MMQLLVVVGQKLLMEGRKIFRKKSKKEKKEIKILIVILNDISLVELRL